MSASSSDRSGAALPAAETSPATRTETRPYIESMIESLRQAGDRPVLRWDGADTTGSQLLAAIYRYARALESLGHRTRRLGGDVRAEPARGTRPRSDRSTCSATASCLLAGSSPPMTLVEPIPLPILAVIAEPDPAQDEPLQNLMPAATAGLPRCNLQRVSDRPSDQIVRSMMVPLACYPIIFRCWTPDA